MAYTDLDSIHTPTAGQRPPASWGAQVNANFDAVYDAVLAKLGAWTTWTPSLVQSGTVTKTVSVAEYLKIGRWVTGNALMVVTGSGTSGQPIVVGLPVAMASSGNLVIGNGWVYDASGVVGYHGALIRVSSTTAILWASGQSNNIGATPAFGLASSDQIGYQFSYQTTS